MVQTHLIGLPVIGKKRELKFLLESYINKSIVKKVFFKKFKNFLRDVVLFQEKEMDIINIGSFTYPDIFTSTLLLLNLIDSHYIGENIVDSIIKITRGSKDLKPFKMVKWFGTNFHYFIPYSINNSKDKNKINDFFIKTDLDFSKSSTKKKISVLGPFSIIYILTKNKLFFSTKRIIRKFRILLKKYKKKVNFFQFEEPFFKDSLNSKYIKLYKNIYKNFSKKDKIIFTNYFSCIKKNIKHVKTYGIHLDLVENKYNKSFLKKKVSYFKIVSLGILNGRNIWICNFLKILKVLSFASRNLLISSNCSFLHIPYDINLEKRSSINIFFSFFLQKIKELKLIKKKINNGKGNFKKNFSIHKTIKKIREKISGFKIKKYKKKDFVSLYKLGLHKFPITTIGSFSQTKKIRTIRNKFYKQKICYKTYRKIIKMESLKLVKMQKKLGIDVLTNGELERNDMVQFFCEKIKGFLITNNGWVQSYCTRCTKPPIIYNNISKNKIEIYRWVSFINLKNKGILKVILTGPITMFKWSFNIEGLPPKNVIFRISKILRKKIIFIAKKRIKIIQIDEPAIREFIDSEKNKKKQRRIIVNSFNYMCGPLKNKNIQVHTHICYSELTKNDIKMFKKMSIDVITIESSSNIRKNVLLIRKYGLCKSLEVGLGIYNVHSKLKPSSKKIFNNILKIKKKINSKRIWINPDCGLKTRKEEEIVFLLKRMSAAVKKLKKKIC
ncbi:cobalamin-independent homocysteine transmethylase [Candidatus Vidania fulgoroideae]|nr:cobalamin-independent homocysteine transmethylase [Candidatus Vidania fulgoroideae]